MYQQRTNPKKATKTDYETNYFTKGIYSLSVSPFKSATLQSQVKVQPNKPYKLILYPKAKAMKTIVTLVLALFIQVSVFSQLTSFAALLNTDKVDLKWSASAEKGISHFSIEKSTDGKNYSQAGIVFAFENTTDTMNYPFTDKNINARKSRMIYYRISVVANNGKSELLQIRAVSI